MRHGHPSRGRKGFTLLEVLVALTLLLSALAIIYGSFSAALRAWQQGSTLLDDMHEGDFLLDQLVASLRSAAFFPDRPDWYGFHLESREEGRYPNDRISWVASGSAFLAEDSYLAHGLHRIELTVDTRPDGGRGLAVFAYPHLADRDDLPSTEPWFVSSLVQGLSCRVWNSEHNAWEDRWEDTNSIPGLVEITLYLPPLEARSEPVQLQRLVEIPMGQAVTQVVSFARADAASREAAERSPARRREPPRAREPAPAGDAAPSTRISFPERSP